MKSNTLQHLWVLSVVGALRLWFTWLVLQHIFVVREEITTKVVVMNISGVIADCTIRI